MVMHVKAKKAGNLQWKPPENVYWLSQNGNDKQQRVPVLTGRLTWTNATTTTIIEQYQ